MEGYLDKSSPSILKNFQKRWCVVSDGFFRYFKKKTDKQPAGTICLQDVLRFVRLPKPLHFELHTRDRKYLFLAPTEAELLGWEKSLTPSKSPRSTGHFSVVKPSESDNLRRTQSDNTSSPYRRSEGSMGNESTSLRIDAKLTMEEVYQIDPRSIKFLQGNILGKGGYGTVEKAEWRGIEVAVKKMHSFCALEEVLDELRALCQIHHPRCMQLLGYCESDNTIWLITEFVKGGSLSELVRNKNKILTQDTILDIAISVCQGMIYLHDEKRIIHRDLKSGNILIESLNEESVSVKIADFGISQKEELLEDIKNNEKVGTPYIMAPEVCRENHYTTKSDVFSFGMLLWECFAREAPWSEASITFSNQILSKIESGERPPLEKLTCQAEIQQLIAQCWDQNPENRPSFVEAMDILKKIRGKRFSSCPMSIQASSSGSLYSNLSIGSFSNSLRMIEKVEIDKEGIKKFVATIFADRTHLPWTDLQQKLLSEWKSDEYGLRPIRSILEKPGEEGIPATSFEKFLQWFFPIIPDTESPDDGYEDPNRQKVDEIPTRLNDQAFTISYVTSILKAQWFHGFVSTTDAVSKLKRESSGSYLIRFSSSDDGVYSISVNDRGTIKHWKIQRIHNKCYSFNNTDRTFSDIIAFVSYYKTKPLDIEGGIEITLDMPCPK